jgi:hypothetical protein
MDKLFIVTILIIAGLFISLLTTHVIVDVTMLYQIPYLINFNFVQVYGATLVIGYFTYKHPESKETDSSSFGEQVVKSVTMLLTKVVTILLSWWFAYIMFKFIG